ncbi:glycosyltransferase family 2 protein [Agromyces aerolatus]|uniref:glycosyltransferase family 2 protein n=1 Tax=Agromyces sp. LY-1074 TaxID=3074080 RepID=UPI0028614C5B|nr:MULTISPECIES: glycosyltransferase [unclassified Agromyces]MDR5700386.1 glycosyltransferase [Agromyces sp. LY-1074]MDR5706636.1 glycosyltransferase [Agromyces sp. LY-1358]
MTDSAAPRDGEPIFLDLVMPFWGDPAQFRLAVESVLAQDAGGWRLTIIDDAYPDPAPGAWAASLDDPRVVAVRSPENRGVNGSFREAVRIAEAPYTVIVGCDDVLLPGFVRRIRELADAHPQASYLQPGVEVIDASGRVTRPLADRVKAALRPRLDGFPRELAGEALAASLLRANWTYFPSIAWRTDALKRFDFRPDYEVVLDLALQIEIVESGGSMVLDDVPAFQYRRHAASVSSWRAAEGSRFEEERRYLSEAAAGMRRRGWTRAARAAANRATSRLNALSVLPRALLARDGAGTRALVRHGLGR